MDFLLPYWQYRFIQVLQGDNALLGPLVRAGRLDLADRLAKATENDESLIFNAIDTDDVDTLKFLAPLEPTNYVKYAFMQGADQALLYLISHKPEYLQNITVLNEILKALLKQDNPRGIFLLDPDILNLTQRLPKLHNYILSIS